MEFIEIGQGIQVAREDVAKIPNNYEFNHENMRSVFSLDLFDADKNFMGVGQFTDDGKTGIAPSEQTSREFQLRRDLLIFHEFPNLEMTNLMDEGCLIFKTDESDQVYLKKIANNHGLSYRDSEMFHFHDTAIPKDWVLNLDEPFRPIPSGKMMVVEMPIDETIIVPENEIQVYSSDRVKGLIIPAEIHRDPTFWGMFPVVGYAAQAGKESPQVIAHLGNDNGKEFFGVGDDWVVHDPSVDGEKWYKQVGKNFSEISVILSHPANDEARADFAKNMIRAKGYDQFLEQVGTIEDPTALMAMLASIPEQTITYDPNDLRKCHDDSTVSNNQVLNELALSAQAIKSERDDRQRVAEPNLVQIPAPKIVQRR